MVLARATSRRSLLVSSFMKPTSLPHAGASCPYRLPGRPFWTSYKESRCSYHSRATKVNLFLSASPHPVAAALRRNSGSRLSRACRGEPVEGEAAPTGQEILLILPKPPAPEVGGSAAQSASGASTFLRRQEGPPGFPPQPRRKPRPRSPLSMPRLCVFAEQTSLPLLTRRDWKPLPQCSFPHTLKLGEEGDHLHDLTTASRP